MKLSLSPLLASAAILLTSQALAYPTSVVFTPTAEAKPQGTFGLLAYTGTNFRPRTSPGSSWFGGQVGLLPTLPYGNSGVSFGGLEIGADLITPYEGRVKPVLNAKLGLLTESKYSPSLALGAMELSPKLPSMTYTYTSLSKTFGRLTVGFGTALGARSQFQGLVGTRAIFAAAYESPLAWNKVGFQLDYLGGVSEISSTYLGPTVALTSEVNLSVGVYLPASTRTPSYVGGYGMLTVTLDAKKWVNQ